MAVVSDLLRLAVEIAFTLLASVLAPEKCCEDLGCFSLGPPWSSVFRPLPPLRCNEECPVLFHMFFRNNTNISEVQTVAWPVDSLNDTLYDGMKPTVLYVGGLGNHINDQWNVNLRTFYLQRRDVNFIYLDWDRCKYEWRDALASLRVMAAQASRLLNHFVQHFGAHPSRFHLIGHSWGGHLAAYIARNIKGCKRLTGLDPAYFYFWSNSKEIQIKKDDAEFVEIGHTANLPIVGVGIREPKGHIDYYFNGNWLQPSCILEGTRTFVKKFKEEGTFDALRFAVFILGCGHIRALEYYIESLRKPNCTLWGERMNAAVNLFNGLTGGAFAEQTTSLDRCELDSCSPFGLDAIDYPARGIFTVATSEKVPYCTPRPQIDKMMAEKLEMYKRELYKDHDVNSTLRPTISRNSGNFMRISFNGAIVLGMCFVYLLI